MKQRKVNGVGGKFLLVALGLLPAVAGRLMNWYFMRAGSAQYFMPISAAFLIFWGLLAFAVSPLAKHAKEAALLLNAAATIDLLLLGIQEIILGSYWPNWFGAWTQLFLLPPLPVGSALAFWSRRMFPSYLASVAFMLLMSWLGAKGRRR